MATPHTKLWAGEFFDGEVVIFDPALQHAVETDWVYLWSVDRQAARPFVRDIARNAIRVVEGERKQTLIMEYLRDKAIANRRSLFRRLGLPYKETRAATGRSSTRVRKTWCWNCKSDLDNRIQLECNDCGWIICECGACGCGR